MIGDRGGSVLTVDAAPLSAELVEDEGKVQLELTKEQAMI